MKIYISVNFYTELLYIHGNIDTFEKMIYYTLKKIIPGEKANLFNFQSFLLYFIKLLYQIPVFTTIIL